MFFLIPYVAGALLAAFAILLALRWARHRRTPWSVLAARRLGRAVGSRQATYRRRRTPPRP